MADNYQRITNLLFKPQGKHDPAQAYSILDVVTSNNGSRVYFALQDVPANTALDDTRYWMLQIDLSGVSSGGGSGEPGEDGGYYMPNVDENGNLSWTASKDGMPFVAEANIRGPQGIPGTGVIAINIEEV